MRCSFKKASTSGSACTRRGGGACPAATGRGSWSTGLRFLPRSAACSRRPASDASSADVRRGLLREPCCCWPRCCCRRCSREAQLCSSRLAPAGLTPPTGAAAPVPGTAAYSASALRSIDLRSSDLPAAASTVPGARMKSKGSRRPRHPRRCAAVSTMAAPSPPSCGDSAAPPFSVRASPLAESSSRANGCDRTGASSAVCNRLRRILFLAWCASFACLWSACCSLTCA
mmetsp:Transcript_83828/g.233861  ORF Transcript_83828/g.233861 Transcript_83828/m.233861 type:complete len:229 (+) Transcript_83828:976-1662(+)